MLDFSKFPLHFRYTILDLLNFFGTLPVSAAYIRNAHYFLLTIAYGKLSATFLWNTIVSSASTFIKGVRERAASYPILFLLKVRGTLPVSAHFMQHIHKCIQYI